jgi:hypothetical protein
MEDYRLEQSGQEVQDILDGAAMQTDLTAETDRAELAEQTLQGNIDDEALARQNADGVLQGKIDDEEARAKTAEKQNADDIDAIEEKIPNQASSSNQLADKEYVEDLVSTASATFRGTFNLVSDLHLTIDASRSDIAAALGNAIATADNNDFAFVMIPTSVETPNEIASIEKYKFNGTVWGFEYVLNNSGFTAAQWAAINSGITSALVTKLGALPTAAELATELLAKQDKLTFDSAPTPESTNPVTSGGVYTAVDNEKGARQNADQQLQQAIEAILVLIPSAATALNQLADKAFVNSSIATATATFRGTYNLVSDLHLALDASHSDIAAALLNAVSNEDNNDYAFVQIPTSVDTPTEIRVTERYKFNGTAWAYEYDLNNSGFTATQWEAINSGITALLVQKLGALPTAAELATSLAGKQNVLTFDNVPTSGSDNPVKSGGIYNLFAAIDAKMPSDASANNKLVAENRLAAYVTAIIEALDASFDVTSTDGHVTFRITQTNGQIASVQILTSDIASASALTTLTGRVSTNETDIANLQAAYAALTQSDVIIVNGALPSSGQQQNKIYRQPDPDHTPPQFYSDYMWNGSTWVLMATYNNAIDPRPKKGSQNLVTSGGVFDNMGALDVSELNATESPHTLATYADLSAALAAIPSDYQKGGMSIKFVQSSDNKYRHFYLIENEFTTDVAQWQYVDSVYDDVYVVEESRNKFDKDNIIANSTIDNSGNIIPNPYNDVCVSNKIPFNAGDVLRTNDTAVHLTALYYNDGTFELFQYGSERIAQKKGYVRYVVANSGIDAMIATINEPSLLYTPYYFRKVSKLSYFNYVKKISRNHFNKETVVPNSTIYQYGGNLTGNSGTFVTAMIRVNKGDVINHSSAAIHNHAYYDLSGTFINWVQYGADNEVVQQDGFIRLTINDGDKDTFVLCINNKDVSYCPYHEPFTIPMTLDKDVIVVGEGYNLREALEKGKENGLNNIQTTIYVPEGTYNVMDLFTAEEINAAEYTETGFVGLEVTDNVSLIGMGDKSRVILHGELSTSDYNITTRGAISTLNLKGKVRLENLTVESVNIRYPIHDDFGANKDKVHDIVNCVFNNITPLSQAATSGYGLGTRSGSVVNIKDSVIIPDMIYHDNTSFTRKSIVNMYSSYVSNILSIWSFGNLVSELNLFGVSYGNMSIDGQNILINDYIHGVNNAEKAIIQQFNGKVLTFNQDGTITWNELT